MADPVWNEIEATLSHLFSLPHNQSQLRARGSSPAAEVKKKLAEIRSGLSGVPKKEEFFGPKLFLRVVGAANRAYSGEWWFDAELLDNLERAYSRLYFQSADKKSAIRDMLRELLAISREWNTIEEVWALELPAGEKLTGYSGIGAPQKLFGNLPLSDKANRMLVGQARQIFFPVKNPLWVKQYRHFT